ncbi:hypothetical protein [Luteococcus sp.]|uniref:hypothetical protein n=1 Tax=Luteococcus sp. TaxID=1969402 RepID=UPI003734D2A7
MWSAPDLSNPTAVGAAFVQVYATQDAAVDPSPWAAPARASRFATPAYAKALRSATSTGGDEMWQQLVDYDAATVVGVEPAAVAAAPADTAAVVYRAYRVRIEGQDDKGWSSTAVQTHIVKLVKHSGAWAVDNSQLVG